MRGISRYRPSPATAIALTALVVALGGAAYATIPDSNGVIRGCYQKNGGILRIVDDGATCRQSEQALDWNQRGQPGPPGGLTNAFAEETSEVSTASRTTFVDLGGPTVTATVPPSGLMAAVVRAEVHGAATRVDPDDQFLGILGGCIGLFIDSETVGGSGHDLFCEQGGVGEGVPSTFRERLLDWYVFEAEPGPHTFSLRYRTRCLIGSQGCPAEDRGHFRNRKLWVIPLG